MKFDLCPRQMIPILRLGVELAVVLCAVAGVPAVASDPGTPRISYTKILKGSFPEYLSITVDQRGTAVYEGHKLDEPASPRNLQLSEETTRRIFGLAAELNNFDTADLESYKKVANLGKKTLVYDDGTQQHQVTFNYTQRRTAQDLVEIFDRVSLVAEHISSLEYLIKFDHLSLPAVLKQIQIEMDRHILADPELLAPTLEKIVRNPRFLHLAQARAQNILDRLPEYPKNP